MIEVNNLTTNPIDEEFLKKLKRNHERQSVVNENEQHFDRN